MFPEKTFYNHDKLAFLVPFYETLSSALNKSYDDGCLKRSRVFTQKLSSQYMNLLL